MSGGSFNQASTKKDLENYMQLLKGAEKEGVAFEKRMGANSIEELRKMDPKKFLNELTATSEAFWPIIDGYVITDDQYKLYKNGKYNDVPVMVGITSDEGTMFTLQAKPGEYIETTRQRFGPVADKVLSLYPDSTEAVTRRSMTELFRDLYFGWPTYTWATLQTKTGKSPVYVYYFDQSQPASPVTVYAKSTGAYHGSDCAYIFDHLDQNPIMKYTDEDRHLSQIMIDYWTNFANCGNPNGKGLPEWPVYAEGKPTIMYLKNDLKTGSYPNIDKIKVIDEYYAWKRALGEESK